MKKTTLRAIFLMAILLVSFHGISRCQLLYDDFTGLTAGANLSGQSGWNKGGTGPEAKIGNTTTLTYANYNGGGAEYVILPAPSSTTSKIYKALNPSPAPGTNTFYYSLLLRLTATTTASGNYFISLGDASTGYFARLFVQTSGAGFNIGISKMANTATYGTTSYNLNTTYLVVVRYDFVTGTTNDPVYVWVNPSLDSEPSAATADATISSGTDGNFMAVGNFLLHNRSLTNPVGSFDAVRVAYGATSSAAWTSLNANIVSPPAAFAVTGGGSYCQNGAGMPVNLAGSEIGVTYTLYQNSVAQTPTKAGTGSAITYGNQAGTYSYTIKGTSPYGTTEMTGSAIVIEMVCTPTWSGLVNGDWNTSGNWVGGNVPSDADDVIIPAGCPVYPVLLAGSTTYCQDLEVAGSGIKSASSPGGLSISGELEVGGNLIITTNGSLDITAGGALTVTGDLTISGILLVESQGSLLTNGAVTGTAIIQRCITPDLGWHFLSSPVVNQEICNGEFAPIDDNSFPGNIETWDFYKWLPNCPAPPDKPWINLRTSAGNVDYAEFGSPPSFEVTKGYLVAYGNGFQTTKSFVGIPNTGDKTCTFFDIATACEFALAGNPFPSAIDWNYIDKSNLVNNYYYLWNQNKPGTGGEGGYEYYGGLQFHSPGVNGRIPSMQGFFVCVRLDGGKTLELPNEARTHDVLGDYWLKEIPANKLSITLGDGNNYDEAVVMFENSCKVGKDRNDAEKLFSMSTGIPQVYTIVDNDLKACLNAMPEVINGTTVPVGFVAPVNGNYSIRVTGIESFSPMTGLLLEDLKLNITQDLRQNPVYNFSATGNEDAGRFLLHFAGPIGFGETDNSAISIYSSEKTVFITCAAGFLNAQVTISSLLGQEILTRKLNDQTSNQVNVNALKGYYIVKVQTESSVKTAKVYIN